MRGPKLRDLIGIDQLEAIAEPGDQPRHLRGLWHVREPQRAQRRELCRDHGRGSGRGVALDRERRQLRQRWKAEASAEQGEAEAFERRREWRVADRRQLVTRHEM